MEAINIAIKAIKRLTGYFIVRPLQRYNIEERAFKRLEKQSMVIKPAPKHKTTQELLDQIERDHPEILNDIKKEPEELLKRLTEVKVHSTGKDPVLMRDKSKLPEFTRGRPGYEPAIVPKGKLTLKTYCELLNLRHRNPYIYTPAYFAEKYDIDVEQIEELLDHFRAFQVYSPDTLGKPRVPWWGARNIEDFLFEGVAPYHHAKIAIEEKEDEEGRRVQEEARRKIIEEQKLEAAEWYARQKKISDSDTRSKKVLESGDVNSKDEKIDTSNKSSNQ